ncbi:MAG: hypothetical protein IPN88_17375 [Bacteroidetes bacterium]|nr:hypothetical protein [Bacteroidota bacterium]
MIELRKSAPKVNRGDLVIPYSSSPIKAISGTCKIEEIVTLSPALLWRRYSHILGIDRKRYFDYYEGKEFAVGIILKDIKKSKSRTFIMLIGRPTPNGTGIEIFGDYWDLDSLYNTLHAITTEGTASNYVLLGFAYDVRKKC